MDLRQTERSNRRSQLVSWRLALAILAGLFTAALVGVFPTTANAGHISCGAVLGPGGSFVLDSNVGPCPGPTTALTVDSANLDLAGFTVSCQGPNPPIGIEVVGTAAQVTNGRVQDCGFAGVQVGGSGQHLIRHLTSRNNQCDGFFIDSKNSLIQNTAIGNGCDGFDAADGNLLLINTAIGNAVRGFFLSDRNIVFGNTAALNLLDGFNVDGDRNVLVSNVAQNNQGNGIHILSGGSRNFVIRNTSQGHQSPDFDLADDNSNCDNNFWRQNTFATKSQACIQ